MKLRILLTSVAIACGLAVHSQNEVVNQSRVFLLPPFERAVVVMEIFP